MERLLRLADRTVDGLALLAGVLMVLLTVVVTIGVVSRYFFELPIRATAEGAGLIFAWLVFLAAISVTHNQDNIAVTYFRGKLPAVLQPVAVVAMKILMLVFACLMTYSSVQLTTAVAEQRMPVLQISTAWLNGSVAVAFSGMALVLLIRIVGDVFFPDLVSADEEINAAEEGTTQGGPERLGGFE
jgi:TRAP-type transport system small permease protein